MRIAVDEEGLARLGAVLADVAASLGAVDLTSVAAAVVDAMPGSRSAQVSGVVLHLQARLQEAVDALGLEAGRVGLAAERYAAVDASGATHTATTPTTPTTPTPAAP